MNGQASNSLFLMKERKDYEGTPYFSVSITINISLSETKEIKLVVNRKTGHVNLTRLYKDLQNGTAKSIKNYLDWISLMSTVKYFDAFSFIKYGHVFYTIDGKEHIYDTNEFDISNINEYKVKPKFVNFGKLTNTSLLITPKNELIGEIYNGLPNELKGTYGDYNLITKMMSNISPMYESINNEFIAYIIPVLSNKGSNLVKEMSNPIQQLIASISANETNSGDAEYKQSMLTEDLELTNILRDPTTHKGKLAELKMLKYLKRDKWFKDLKMCAHIPNAMDLVDPTLKTRFEIKCRTVHIKDGDGLDKFHRDVKYHEHDTNVFVYVDLCPSSNIVSHMESQPMRFYINGYDVKDETIEFIYQSIIHFDDIRVSEYQGAITSKILLKSIKKELSDGIKVDVIPTIKEAFKECFRDLIYKRNLNSVMNDLASESIERNEYNEEEELHNTIDDIIDQRKDDSIKRFLIDNYAYFKVGYYVKDKSFMLYNEWAKTNQSVVFTYRDFNKYISRYCMNRRISVDPCTNQRSNLHYWVLKIDLKAVDEQK